MKPVCYVCQAARHEQRHAPGRGGDHAGHGPHAASAGTQPAGEAGQVQGADRRHDGRQDQGHAALL